MKIGTRVFLTGDLINRDGQKFRKGIVLIVVGNDEETVHLKGRTGKRINIYKTRMAHCVKKVKW